MNRIFKIENSYQVPDGTLVSPFLNAKDSMSSLPFDLLDGFSLAAGTIEPGVSSKIHIMPHVTQVTFVTQGELLVKMKGPEDPKHYSLELQKNEAVLTEAGTYFQLLNQSTENCEVLYIVSPAYLVEIVNGELIYDDSLILDLDWKRLEKAEPSQLPSFPTLAQRQAAERRMSERSCFS